MQKRFVTLFLLLVCSHAAAQDPLRQFSEGTHVRVRLKTEKSWWGAFSVRNRRMLSSPRRLVTK